MSAVRGVGYLIAIAIAFVMGLMFTVYLSLRSSEVKVPDVVGKDRFVAENELKDAGLNFRVRATRPSNQVKADSVIFQLPRAGDVVKTGQTVAVDVSRPTKEGEVSETVSSEDNKNANKGNDNRNTNEASGNSNENKPKRNRNANANGNANANANANSRSANSNRPKPNANTNGANVNGDSNANRRANTNSTTPTTNQNANRPNRNLNRTVPPTEPTPPPNR